MERQSRDVSSWLTSNATYGAFTTDRFPTPKLGPVVRESQGLRDTSITTVPLNHTVDLCDGTLTVVPPEPGLPCLPPRAEVVVLVGLSLAGAARLQSWVGGKTNPSAWKEVYLASRDGWDAGNFYARCDGKSRLLILVQDKEGWLFGAFTEVGLTPVYGDGVFYPDIAAFLFSLTNPAGRPERLASKGFGKEMRYSSGFLAAFGTGVDLAILPRANISSISHASPGTSFDAPAKASGREQEEQGHPVMVQGRVTHWSAREIVAWTMPR